MAKTVGTLLNDSPNLRKVLFAGLQKLIEKNVEVAALSEPDPQVHLFSTLNYFFHFFPIQNKK